MWVRAPTKLYTDIRFVKKNFRLLGSKLCHTTNTFQLEVVYGKTNKIGFCGSHRVDSKLTILEKYDLQARVGNEFFPWGPEVDLVRAQEGYQAEDLRT